MKVTDFLKVQHTPINPAVGEYFSSINPQENAGGGWVHRNLAMASPIV